jgi:transcriptional regulator with GAF, ATPase, and Fis domain
VHGPCRAEKPEIPAQIALRAFENSAHNEISLSPLRDVVMLDVMTDEAEVQINELIGVSRSWRKVLQQIDLVAASNATVLITGESGTGKELVAKAVHLKSERRQRPMVTINCAAIAPELFESEFFGHVKGAFTGAKRPDRQIWTRGRRHDPSRRGRRDTTSAAKQTPARITGRTI